VARAIVVRSVPRHRRAQLDYPRRWQDLDLVARLAWNGFARAQDLSALFHLEQLERAVSSPALREAQSFFVAYRFVFAAIRLVFAACRPELPWREPGPAPFAAASLGHSFAGQVTGHPHCLKHCRGPHSLEPHSVERLRIPPK